MSYDPRVQPMITDETGRRWPGVPGFGNPVQEQAPETPREIVVKIGEPPPRHPRYEERKAAYKFYQASYDGGSAYKNTMDADGMPVLPKHDAESDANYRRRKSLSTYRNYCRPITDKFFAFVFGSGVQRPSDSGFEAWAEDVDGQGSTYAEFMENAVRQAMILGRWYVIADTTKVNEYETRSQAEGNRLLLANLHPCRVLDWCNDESSELLVKHDTADGFGEVWLWTDYDVTMCPLDEKGLVRSMTSIPHGWDGMPIVRLDGLNGSTSIIRDISEENKRLFHDTSLLVEESEKQIFSQFFLFGMSGDDIRETDTVSIGSRKYICISKPDAKIERAAGDPAMSESLRANIDADIKHIYREAGLRMPDLESGPESGRALRIRQSETIAIAERLAENAENSENRVLSLFEQAFGAEVEPIQYSKSFDEEDMSEQLKETLDIATSEAFGPKMKGEVAAEYIGKKFPELKSEIRQELAEEARELFELQARQQSVGAGPDGKPPSAPNAVQQFDQASRSLDGLKKTLGDGEANPDKEPDEPEQSGASSGVDSGAPASSGRGKPGELRHAPEGDIRFDTTRVMVNPSMRAAQHKVDEDAVAALIQSFKANGWDAEKSSGILAVVMKTGHYATLDGHHRQEAAVRAGLKEIPANALTQDQFTALLQLRFGAGMPRKMRLLDPYVFVDGVPYTEIRDDNNHKVGSQNASSMTN